MVRYNLLKPLPIMSTLTLTSVTLVDRIMKNALPENARIAKEAKECMQQCVSEFISFITSEGRVMIFISNVNQAKPYPFFDNRLIWVI